MEQQIYWNGSIITMEDATPVAQALLVQDGTILAMGTKEEILAKAAVSTRKIDLQGAALLPSFIDAHSHFMGYATGLLQPSLEQTTDFQQLIHTIQDFIRENHIPKGHWVLAKGYDHNQLAEKCHPTRELLDQAAPEHPLIIQHQSGHMGVLNSLALELLGITPDTPAPSGGKIQVEGGSLTGYLEENAFVEYLKKLPIDAMGDLAAALQTAQERYLQYGITTMQEGMSMDAMLPLFQRLTSQNRLKLDLITYVDPNDSRKLLETFPMGKYHNRLRIGGYKIFLDGSPQSRTAWLQEPYEGAQGNERGYPALKEEQVEQAVDRALEENCQLLAHCNGDAACLQFLSAYQKARRGKKGRDIRPVMIHAQMLPPELLPQLKAVGMIPSFFVAHVYHWGEVHIKNLGLERASRISPAGSAEKLGIPYTFHQDAPVIQPDMLETVWCAVERKTKTGRVLGKEERVSVWQALKAVTTHAAYQYFEEDKKGSLVPGKLANLVILDKNPLQCPPEDLPKIHVLSTIREGELLYDRSSLF